MWLVVGLAVDAMPPPLFALLPLIVEPVMVSALVFSCSIPPPDPLEVFPLIALFTIWIGIGLFT